jgi:hypothetical protein
MDRFMELPLSVGTKGRGADGGVGRGGCAVLAQRGQAGLGLVWYQKPGTSHGQDRRASRRDGRLLETTRLLSPSWESPP